MMSEPAALTASRACCRLPPLGLLIGASLLGAFSLRPWLSFSGGACSGAATQRLAAEPPPWPALGTHPATAPLADLWAVLIVWA